MHGPVGGRCGRGAGAVVTEGEAVGRKAKEGARGDGRARGGAVYDADGGSVGGHQAL